MLANDANAALIQKRIEGQIKRAKGLPASIGFDLGALAHITPGLFGELKQRELYADAIAKSQPTTLLACFPRSASTFTSEVMRHFTGSARCTLSYDRGRSDHDLYVPHLLSNLNRPVLAQQHLHATRANIELINFFQIRTIVLVRNIYDVLASLFDAARAGILDAPTTAGETPLMNSAILDLDDESLMDVLLDLRLGWYLNFYTSWAYAIEFKHIDSVIVTYEEMKTDSLSYFRKILDSLGQDIGDDALQDAIDLTIAEKKHRLSVGVVGRGKDYMNDRQMTYVVDKGKRMQQYYPWMNLSLMGL